MRSSPHHHPRRALGGDWAVVLALLFLLTQDAQHWRLATRSGLASQSGSECVSRGAVAATTDSRPELCDTSTLPCRRPRRRRCWRALPMFWRSLKGDVWLVPSWNVGSAA